MNSTTSNSSFHSSQLSADNLFQEKNDRNFNVEPEPRSGQIHQNFRGVPGSARNSGRLCNLASGFVLDFCFAKTLFCRVVFQMENGNFHSNTVSIPWPPKMEWKLPFCAISSIDTHQLTHQTSPINHTHTWYHSILLCHNFGSRRS